MHLPAHKLCSLLLLSSVACLANRCTHVWQTVARMFGNRCTNSPRTLYVVRRHASPFHTIPPVSLSAYLGSIAEARRSVLSTSDLASLHQERLSRHAVTRWLVCTRSACHGMV
jgi:hypothetical protein